MRVDECGKAGLVFGGAKVEPVLGPDVWLRPGPGQWFTSRGEPSVFTLVKYSLDC